MLKVGITGGIGSGKTTVCKIFESFGVAVFYADEVARSITKEESVRQQIVELFGKEMYQGSNLQRQKLASIVFNDDRKLKELNAIIHPAVGEAYKKWLLEHDEAKYTLKEAAILFESGSNKGLDKTIVVTAPKNIRIQRVMQRDGVEAREVESRMSKQWAEEKLIKLADFQINNDGKIMLEPQVMAIHDNLMAL